MFFQLLMFDIYVKQNKTSFLVRFLSIHPVQSVVNNMSQLSGIGFPQIVNMNVFSFCLSKLFVLFVYFNMEAGPYNLEICNFEC